MDIVYCSERKYKERQDIHVMTNRSLYYVQSSNTQGSTYPRGEGAGGGFPNRFCRRQRWRTRQKKWWWLETYVVEIVPLDTSLGVCTLLVVEKNSLEVRSRVCVTLSPV